MLAEAAPARHASLDGPDSPAAAGLYQRITATPPAPVRARRRTRFLPVALVTAAVAALAVAAALVLLPGPHTSGGGRAQLAAWSVARQPDGLVNVTIRELRDPMGLWRVLRADGVPANVRFLPHYFEGTTSASAIPRGCRAPHLSDRANALLQGKIMPLVSPGRALLPGSSGVVLLIRPSAIPPGIGLFVKAWAAAPGSRPGELLSLQTDLVQVSPQCTGR